MICNQCETSFKTNRRVQRQIERLNSKYNECHSDTKERDDWPPLCPACLISEFAKITPEVTSKEKIKNESENGNGNGIHHYKLATDEEFQLIKERVTKTMSSIEIIRIEKSINPYLLSNYKRIIEDLGLSCETDSFDFDPKSNENYMFHGSSNDTYSHILEKGFDLSYSKPTGLLGQGIYFAENASYSTGYAQLISTDEGAIKNMLLCRVLIGKSTEGSTGLTKLPKGYHSSKSKYDSIYAVFDNFQAYPEYIIYYKIS